MSNQNFEQWHDAELERLKQEAGYIDFSTINALRIASRQWVGYNKDGSLKKGLALCVEKRKKPYALTGYFVASVWISGKAQEANDMTLLNGSQLKPNYLLFFALKEYICGNWYERYQVGAPPFIAKLQAVNPILIEIRRVLQEAKEYGLYPWLISYYGANPKIFGKHKMFEIGALKRERLIQELPEFEKLKLFKQLLENYGLKHPNGVISITPSDFDKAYKEAFKEEIEAWQFIKQKMEEEPTEEQDENLADEEDSQENWDFSL